MVKEEIWESDRRGRGIRGKKGMEGEEEEEKGEMTEVKELVRKMRCWQLFTLRSSVHTESCYIRRLL